MSIKDSSLKKVDIGLGWDTRCDLDSMAFLSDSNGVIKDTVYFGGKNKKGIFEYILGGCKDTKLLEIRVFDEPTKKEVYQKQTRAAQSKGKSNCPLCAISNNVLKTKIWKLNEMEADHIQAWSKGGSTDIKNCQMLCQTHNRAKGNR